VQAPYFTQSYNRYAYCLNNPLIYTDPDGEFPFLLLGFLIGAYIGGVGSNNGELNPFQWDWQAPSTYLGIGFGGLAGYYAAYGIINPGTMNFVFGVSGNYGGYGLGVGVVAYGGFGSDWSFQWSTSGGGGGEVPLNKKKDVLDQELYPNGVILPYEPNGWERFRDACIVSRIMYEALDMFWVYGTGAFSGSGAYHLAGGSASGTERENAAIGSLLTISPLGWGSKGLFAESSAAKGGTNVIKSVHGNSLQSTRPTWGYKLYSNDGTFLKNGITSQPNPLNRYTKSFMSDKYMVPFEQFPNRWDAWIWEYQQNLIKRGPLNLNMH